MDDVPPGRPEFDLRPVRPGRWAIEDDLDVSTGAANPPDATPSYRLRQMHVTKGRSGSEAGDGVRSRLPSRSLHQQSTHPTRVRHRVADQLVRLEPQGYLGGRLLRAVAPVNQVVLDAQGQVA